MYTLLSSQSADRRRFMQAVFSQIPGVVVQVYIPGFTLMDLIMDKSPREMRKLLRDLKLFLKSNNIRPLLRKKPTLNNAYFRGLYSKSDAGRINQWLRNKGLKNAS
jgi:hypothetical protein